MFSGIAMLTYVMLAVPILLSGTVICGARCPACVSGTQSNVRFDDTPPRQNVPGPHARGFSVIFAIESRVAVPSAQ